MKPLAHFIRLLCLLVASAANLLVISPLLAADLTPREERGRQIYFQGTSPSGDPLIAFFGKDYLEVPGTAATCTSCHGHDGLGRTESGVIPSNITWRYLMKSYGHIHPSGLDHGPFTEESLKSYMRDGLYPGGKLGDPSMPVYEISDRDLDDLIAYMKLVGVASDPGIRESLIRIATIVPDPSGDAGEGMIATIRAYFADINERGGIYGRRLELVVEKAGATESAGEVMARLKEKKVFALVNSSLPGRERELDDQVEALQIPSFAPANFLGVESPALRRYRFQLYAGLREQVRVLAGHATAKLGLAEPRVVIIYPRKERWDGLADVAEEIFRAKGWKGIRRHAFVQGEFDARSELLLQKEEKAELVLFLGGEGDAEAYFREADRLGWAPTVVVPGVLLGRGLYQVPAIFRDKLWLALPSLPDDRTSWGMAEFEQLVERQHLAVNHPTAQLAAYAAAKLLVEGLRRTGRDLSRESLVNTMDKMFEYSTGLTPQITYGRNRRIGALGAYVVKIDPTQAGTKEFAVSQGWTVLE